MEEAFAKAIAALVFSGLTYLIANVGFEQDWNFFIILLVWLVVIFGGFLILDSDGDLF